MEKLKLKITAVALAVVMCFTLSSCSVVEKAVESVSSLINPKGIVEDVSLGYDEIDFGEFSYSSYYEPTYSRESYNALENDKMRELYDMLYYNCYLVYPKAFKGTEHKCKQVILEDATLSESQIRLTIKAIADDNPHVFWMSTTFGFLVDENLNYTAVQLYSRYSPQVLNERITELKRSADSFFKTLKDGMSTYELEKAVHDYILESCEYDTSLTGVEVIPDEEESAFDPYGVLVENSAVCEGYSRAFQMLLNGVGIKCMNIVGESEGELHMWNAVELDGEWYYVDTTWDDKDDGAFKYDYFNISEKQLLFDHEFSKLSSQMSDEEICGDGKISALTSNFFIPECNLSKYNYYIRECAHLESYEAENVVESLKNAAKNKESYFHLYIEPNEFTYEYAVDQLFFSYPQYFFKYVDEVNYGLSDYSLDTSNLSLYQKERLNVVSVVLKYV